MEEALVMAPETSLGFINLGRYKACREGAQSERIKVSQLLQLNSQVFAKHLLHA